LNRLLQPINNAPRRRFLAESRDLRRQAFEQSCGVRFAFDPRIAFFRQPEKCDQRLGPIGLCEKISPRLIGPVRSRYCRNCPFPSNSLNSSAIPVAPLTITSTKVKTGSVVLFGIVIKTAADSDVENQLIVIELRGQHGRHGDLTSRI